jgi:hypothetical protein
MIRHVDVELAARRFHRAADPHLRHTHTTAAF